MVVRVLTFCMGCAYAIFLLHLIFIRSAMYVFSLVIKCSSDIWRTHLAHELDKRKVNHGGFSVERCNGYSPYAS